MVYKRRIQKNGSKKCQHCRDIWRGKQQKKLAWKRKKEARKLRGREVAAGIKRAKSLGLDIKALRGTFGKK